MPRNTDFLAAMPTKIIKNDGVAQQRCQTLNFGTGVTAAYNPATDEVDVTASVGGATDHGALTGLLDNDHTQYGLLTGAVATGTWTWTGGNVAVPAGYVTGLNLRRDSGDPNGVESGSLGDLYVDTATGDLYINDDGSTSWAVISAFTPLALGTTDPVATGGAPDDGSGTTAAKIDHNHDRGTKGSNIASATSINLTAATGDYVHITGTTTITALGTADAGIERECVFDGVLTLTHNATTLILPTAANITTAAGDTASFRSEGSGNWKCTKYARADGTPLSAVTFASTTEFLTGTETAKAVSPNAAAAIWEQGTDITDGATITLGEGGYFNLITSTTAITAFTFTTSKAGRIAVCRAATVRTLTYNAASLILPGAANITTQAGDVFGVVDLGSGNVRVIWYTRADGTALICCTGYEVPLAFFDDPTYGYSIFGSLDVSFLPDNCVVMAKATFAWGATSGDTGDIESNDGAAVLYMRLVKNAGVLVLVGYHNDDAATNVPQYHAMADSLIDFGNPNTSGSVTAYIDTGNLVLSVTIAGTGTHSGVSVDGIANLHIESVFERSELPAP